MTVESDEREEEGAGGSEPIPSLAPTRSCEGNPRQGKRRCKVHRALGAKQRGAGVVVCKKRSSAGVKPGDPKLPRHGSGSPNPLENPEAGCEPDLVDFGGWGLPDLRGRFCGPSLELRE